MTEPLSTWIPWVKYKYPNIENSGYGEYRSNQFLRDPVRAIRRDADYFLSPADGIVLYQKIISADEQKSLDIKGKRYSLQEVLEDNKVTGYALVIGIFMTVYDVHVNRIPYSGILSYRQCAPILSSNKPMDIEEDDILADNIDRLTGDMGGYLAYNARTVNRVYCPELDYSYYICQIADDDINVISPFNPTQNIWAHQGNRFSTVRWGSQVELVLPLDDRFEFQPLANGVCHVTAGVDKLVKLNRLDAPKPLYVSRRLLNTTEIRQWAKEQGFTSIYPPNHMHTTILYSKEPVKWNAVKPDTENFVVENGDRSLARFGDATVLLFDSVELSNRHNKFIDAGGSHDYDLYRSHVTLSYKANGLDLNAITPYSGRLVFGPEVYEEITENAHELWEEDVL